MSTGYLPGAHAADCPVFARVIAAAPPWTRGGRTIAVPPGA
jgi:DNA-3-methyladenine glycosylase I